MKPNIQSCTEDWNKMKIGLHSRFCESCQKNVMDFTDKNRAEILAYLLENYGKETCGRLRPSQLDFMHTDLLVTIKSLSAKHKNTNLPFYLLTLGSLMLSGCDKLQQDNATTGEIMVYDSVSVPKDTLDVLLKSDGEEGITIQPKAVTNLPSTKKRTCAPPETELLTGEVVSTGVVFLEPEIPNLPDSLEAEKETYKIAEVMPEFIGGMDSLLAYLERNVQYPQWESSQKIEGTVIATFIINRDGSISDPKILKTVPGSKNFDNEVIRVVRAMPLWKPGEHNARKVAIQYNLPIRFKL